MEAFQKEKAATISKCQNQQATAVLANQRLEDSESMCAQMALTVQELQNEVTQKEQIMSSSAQQIRNLEASTATLTAGWGI